MLKGRTKKILIILIPIFFALYAAWSYTLKVSQSVFMTDTIRIKQNFHEGIKTVDDIAYAIGSFSEIMKNINQNNFGKFSSDLMKNNVYLKGVTYYSFVKDSNRSQFESFLRNEKLGKTILDSNEKDPANIAKSKKNSFYLPITAVNTELNNQTYFGWNLMSDSSKKDTIDLVLKTKKLQASQSFLLDDGRVAIDVFVPVFNLLNKEIIGIAGVTVDLTRLLGDEEWRKAVTISINTVLSGENTEKNIFRQIDSELGNQLVLTSLYTESSVEKFGVKLGLSFQRDLTFHRVNFGILVLTLIGCIILFILAVYLIITYEKLQLSYAEISAANEHLEQRVKDRTKELALAHAEIKEILDNLDEVVLTISPDLKIGNTFSPASIRILGISELNNKDVREVLFCNLDKHNDDAGRHLFMLENLQHIDEFQWGLTSSDLMNMNSINIQGQLKTLALKYSPIFQADKLIKIILVASDITEILSLKASLAAKQEESDIREIILRENLLSNQEQLQYFYQESEPRCKKLEAQTDLPALPEAAVILRDLHTLKGSSRSVGLKYFAKQVHMLEDQLEPLRMAISQGEQKIPFFDLSIFNNVLKLYHDYEDVYKNLIEKKANSHPAIFALDCVELYLSNPVNNSQGIFTWIQKFKSDSMFSLKALFKSFHLNIMEIAKNLGKEVVFEEADWDIFIDNSIRPALSEAFTHALRNAIDHGIEAQDERAHAGKSPNGVIKIQSVWQSDLFILRIQDDGRGVNPKKVFEIAKEKGLVNGSLEDMSEEAVVDLLFAPGFSTKSDISELSGRGIGLDAVRSSCKIFDITCKIISEAGKGSSFILNIPLKYVLFRLELNNEIKKLF